MFEEEKSIIIPKHNSFGLRNATNNRIVIKQGKMTQIYEGPIVRGCYHGQGLLIWIKGNQKQTYEGNFYVNRLHGYGRMTYENGIIFEGLYKNNVRFGPGVITHPNEHQEVGFWLGDHLLRLSCYLTIHLVPSYDTPDIYGKLKLLQFKHLVDLTRPPHCIINVRDDNENNLNNNHSFPYTRHLNSLFFQRREFDSKFESSESRSRKSKVVDENRFVCGHNLEDLILKNYLKISTDPTQPNNIFLLNCGINIGKQFEFLKETSWTININQDDNTESKIISESVKQLFENEKFDEIQNYYSKCLAFNNNTLDKMILAHTYQQRFSEKTLLYNIENIWSEKRNIFMPPNPQGQESAALNLLSKLDLHPGEIERLIKNYKIDVDISDSRGNTRLMISSANNQHEIIKCMINLGANLECYNDDGFTPLNLTLLQYICLLNDIKKWNEYLIPHISFKFNIRKGDQNVTIKNIQNMNFFEPENLTNIKLSEKYDGIENTKPMLRHLKSKQKLDSVEDTIILLINMGAKPTTCFTPKTSFHLALLTTNPTILSAVFDAGGSPPYTLYNEDYKLNLLHVAALMPTNYNVVECVKILIMHRIDPNSKALPILNVFRYQLPWQLITNQQASMTPLDIYCLKENKNKLNNKLMVDDQSEAKLVSLLYDATDKNHTFCGFNSSALAMLTGKLNLTETLLKKNTKIVNETISGFGTLLTLLLNPNYNANLSNQNLNQLLDMLLGANSNPFKIVEVSDKKFSGNIYDYCFMISESKISNKRKYKTNLRGIVEKLKNAGRAILNLNYSKLAKDAFINNYKNHKILSLPENKKSMLFWLNSDLKYIIQQVEAEKKLIFEPFSIKNFENNKINTKKKIQIKNIEQLLEDNSTVHDQINLTEEEIQVCYECLKHLKKEIKTCSDCYFALFCSNSCKMRHKNNGCIAQKRKSSLVRLTHNLSKSELTIKTEVEPKSYHVSSTQLLSLEKSSMNSMSNMENSGMNSTSQGTSTKLSSLKPLNFSGKSKISITTEITKSSKPIMLPSISLAYSNSTISSSLKPLPSSRKSKTSTADYSNYSKSSQEKDGDTTSSKNYNGRRDKEQDVSSVFSILNTNNNNYLDKVNSISKNKSFMKLIKSSIYVEKSRNSQRNTDKQTCNQYCLKSKLQQRAQNERRHFSPNHNLNTIVFPSVKYRRVKTPCWEHLFKFINRGSSNKDINLLRDLINSQMINLVLGKDGQVYHKVINNYSLI